MRRDQAKAYAEEKGIPVREEHGLLHLVLPPAAARGSAPTTA